VAVVIDFSFAGKAWCRLILVKIGWLNHCTEVQLRSGHSSALCICWACVL